MTKLLKEPLLHFLLVGLGLFVLYEFVAGDATEYDSRVIDVNRDTLMTFVQFRTRAFDPGIAADRLDSMSPDELQLLINDFVREEALYREALALGMDKNDYIIKRRMIQSIEFITSGFVTAAVDLDEDELRDYYQQNRDDYYVDPYVTFTHVYFNSGERSAEEANALATSKLSELNASNVQFSEAPRHGERFPYFVNYVERTPIFLASHFGPQMTEALLELEPNESTWRGPFQSPYGSHLVLLTTKQDGRIPAFNEVETMVRQDAEREAIQKLNDEAIQAIVDTYDVNQAL